MNNLMSKFSNPKLMYQGFFLLLKFCYLISAVTVIRFISEMAVALKDLGAVSGPMMYIPALGTIALSIAAAFFAEKLISQKNPLGLVIGLVLAAFITFSMFFVIGLFGFYALLNPEFRSEYYSEKRPAWLDALFQQLDNLCETKKA